MWYWSQQHDCRGGQQHRWRGKGISNTDGVMKVVLAEQNISSIDEVVRTSATEEK
jgi:hypothetical protein